MSIKQRFKPLKNGEKSIYFDICHKGRRSYEFTDIRLRAGSSPSDREYNKQMLNLAERIKLKRWNEVLNEVHGVSVKINSKADFFKFVEALITERKGFNRGHTGVIKKLKEFVRKSVLLPEEITERFLNKFYDYLELTLTGESPSCYFKKLKRLLNEAVKEKMFVTNPANGIKCRKFTSKVKEILTFDEIRKLLHAHCPNAEVKKAFLFACLTGLRFCDVNELKGDCITGNKLELIQKKTKVKVTIILNADALKIVFHRIKKGELIFKLPSHTSCLKSLRKWSANAEINRVFTFHSSRHSFASNLLFSGTDIFTCSKLLGHTSLKYTERYLRENLKMKEEAVNKLPKLY